jgi:hypothetical protein
MSWMNNDESSETARLSRPEWDPEPNRSRTLNGDRAEAMDSDLKGCPLPRPWETAPHLAEREKEERPAGAHASGAHRADASAKHRSRIQAPRCRDQGAPPEDFCAGPCSGRGKIN